jgi:ElaB/YqjD/DUF883 family membrane-anchored ribosome-binding protein
MSDETTTLELTPTLETTPATFSDVDQAAQEMQALFTQADAISDRPQLYADDAQPAINADDWERPLMQGDWPDPSPDDWQQNPNVDWEWERPLMQGDWPDPSLQGESVLAQLQERIAALTIPELMDDATVNIYVGNEKVFEQVGEIVTTDRLTDDDLAKIEQAFDHPADLQGAVRINLDGELAFQAKDGEVLDNKLPLPALQLQSSAESTQEDHSATTAPAWEQLSASQEATVQQLEAKVLEIATLYAQQLQVLEAKVQALQQVKPLNQRLGEWMQQTAHNAHDALETLRQKAQQLPDAIKQGLKDRAVVVQQQVNDKFIEFQGVIVGKIDEVKTAVTEKFNDAKQAVNRAVADAACKPLDAATSFFATRFGQPDATGNKVWHGNDYVMRAGNDGSSITRKSGEPVVVNGNFTTEANASDRQRLTQLPQDVQKMTAPAQSQSQRPALKA